MATKKESVKKLCLKCQKERPLSKFYLSNSPNYTDKKYPICTDCISDSLDTSEPMSQEAINSVQTILLEMNRPFIFHLYESSVEEAKKRKIKGLFGVYIKNINMQQYRDYTWKESQFESSQSVSKGNTNMSTKSVTIDEEKEAFVIIDERAKEDVIRMLGYDPFIYENEQDRSLLYNKLVDFLDESALEDGFKLQAVIEIVKGFNQIDKINNAITNITNDIDQLATNSGGIKSLIDSKKNILASLIKLAEENGISVKHNNQKSKGAGTLSGIIKTLQEKGFEEGEVNLYDIETSEGMKQVADISNRSIVAQLQFDENDYTAMILEQREIIQDLDSKVSKFEEENRLLKKQVIELKRDGDDNE